MCQESSLPAHLGVSVSGIVTRTLQMFLSNNARACLKTNGYKTTILYLKVFDACTQVRTKFTKCQKIRP